MLAERMVFSETYGSAWIKETSMSRLSRVVLVMVVFGLWNSPARAQAPVSEPIDLSAAANRGFADETAWDGQGGWTDEGPNNDLGSLEPGEKVFSGVRFRVIDPAANGGKSCVVLMDPGYERRGKKFVKPQASASIAMNGQRYRFLYLLHAMGWAPDDELVIGRMILHFADGTSETVEVRSTVDVTNWHKPQALRNAAPVWTGRNRTSDIGLFLSKFAVPDKPIQRLELKVAERAWGIVAISGSRDDIAMPAYEAVSFDFSFPAMKKDYPAVTWAPKILEAMKDVAPLEPRVGAQDGLAKAWLHGQWKILPVLNPSSQQPREITKAELFVPSFFGASKDYQRAAYAPQPAAWSKATQVWYSANVRVPEALKGSPVMLHFDGVDFLGAVFADGQLLKIHTSRFNGFDVELPESVQAGKTVNLSVFCLKIGEAIRNQKCPFMQGTKGGYELGGINAPVYLYAGTPLGLNRLKIETSVARKQISFTVAAGRVRQGYRVQPVITDYEGRPVEAPALEAKPAAASMQWSADWPNPRLWSQDDPYLYRLSLNVLDEAGNVVGTHPQHFGFREVSLRGNELCLNGVPARMFGVSCNHQTVDSWARTDEEYNYRLFRAYREHFGVNAARFHHMPIYPAQLRAADRAGLLTINQSGLWTFGRFANYRAKDEFLRNMKTELAEWVWRDVNSPATMIWDVENEYVSGSPEWQDVWLKLDEIVKTVDTTRPTEHSGAGPYLRKPQPIMHYHCRENYDEVFEKMDTGKWPVTIFGEYWIGTRGGKSVLTLPRETFTVEQFDRLWLRCLEEKVVLQRIHGAAGMFPFFQIENGTRVGDLDIPANAKFDASSFNPIRITDRHELNTLREIEPQINPLFSETCRRMYAPVAGLWRERSHSFEAGKPARRTLYLANDTMSPKRLSVSVTLKIAGQEQTALTLDETFAPGQTRDVEVTIPACQTPGRGELVVTIGYDGGKFVNAKPAQVIAVPAEGKGRTVRVYGGGEALAGALQAAGWQVTPVRDIAAGDSVLVIGENALTPADSVPVQDVLRAKGQQVLVLAQKNVSFEDTLGLAFNTPGAREYSFFASAHNRALLKGQSPDYDYPGGYGRSYNGTYTLPLPGALMPPAVERLFAGTRFEDMPCVRYELPEGNAIFCQLNLQANFETDARSRALLGELLHLLDDKPTRKEGALYVRNEKFREALAGRGFAVADKPEGAALAVVEEREYLQSPALQQAANVLVFNVSGREAIDGRAVRRSPTRHFTTFLVSPTVPGLWDLTTGTFHEIMEAGKFGHSINPPVLPQLKMDRSAPAVVGKTASVNYDVFEPNNYRAVACFYEDGGKRRWITGFDDSQNLVPAMALSIAREMSLAFSRRAAHRIYTVATAREVEIDGNLQDWTYEGDVNLRNWARALPLMFGEGPSLGILYAMADKETFYLAFAANEKTLSAGGDDSLTLTMGENRIELTRQPDGKAALTLNGKPVPEARVAWAALSEPFGDAGTRAAALTPGVAIEACLPRARLSLGSAMKSRIAIRSGGKTYSYPQAENGDEKEAYFTMKMDGAAKKWDARVDISSRDRKVPLEPIGATPGTSFGHPTWGQGDARNYSLVGQWKVGPVDWETTTMRFRAKADGEIRLTLRSQYKTVNGKPLAVWIFYDRIEAKGMTVANGDFEKASGDQPVGWQLWSGAESGKAQYLRDGTALSGQACVKLWHNTPAVQNLTVKKDQEIALTVSAKLAEAPE